MKKVITSAVSRLLLTTLTSILLLALCLNLSTLWSVRAIRRGEVVTSGYFSAIIGSGSMEPTVAVNDLLLVQGCATYLVDDVITYLSPRGSLVTHRIKELTEHGYITKGDANNIADDEIFRQSVLGRAIFVLPAVGGVIDGVLSPGGIGFLCGLCASAWLMQRIGRTQDEDE